jgi:hypothetical protein
MGLPPSSFVNCARENRGLRDPFVSDTVGFRPFLKSLEHTESQRCPFDLWVYHVGQSTPAVQSYRYPTHVWLLPMRILNLDGGIVSALH